MKDVEQKNAIFSLQMQQLLAGSKNSLIVGVLLAVILAYIQFGLISTTARLTWLTLVLLVAIFRAAHIFSYKQSVTSDDSLSHALLVKFRIGVLASGVVWGSASFLMYPANDSHHQMLLIFMLAGLTAGGVVSFSADLISAAGYALTVLVPLLIRLFFAGDSVSVSMGMAVMLYTGFMLVTIRYQKWPEI
jgi:hypothetical protein